MKRSEVRALIESAVSATSQSYRFNSGRITEFNSERSNEYPFLWLEPLQRTTEFNAFQMPFNNWACVIHIANKDAMDSSQEQYEALIDGCDEIAQKFIYHLNQTVSGFNLVTLSGVESVPFIHKQADDTSGVTLSFTLNIPDSTDVC